MSSLAQSATFFTRLYADKAARQYAARIRGDLPARLGLREGRLDPYPVYEAIRSRGTFVRNRLGHLTTADYGACDTMLRSRRFGVQPGGAAYDPEQSEDAEQQGELDFVAGFAGPLPIAVITALLSRQLPSREGTHEREPSTAATEEPTR